MRDLLMTMAAATLCAAFLQWFDRPAPPPPHRGIDVAIVAGAMPG